VDGEHNFHIWRAVVNILNKQLQTAEKGYSSNFGVGLRAKNSTPYEKNSLLRNVTEGVGLGQIHWNELC
jgi:hypothetical protein